MIACQDHTGGHGGRVACAGAMSVTVADERATKLKALGDWPGRPLRLLVGSSGLCVTDALGRTGALVWG